MGWSLCLYIAQQPTELQLQADFRTLQASLVATHSYNFRVGKSRLCLCVFTRFSGTVTLRREASALLILEVANCSVRPAALAESCCGGDSRWGGSSSQGYSSWLGGAEHTLGCWWCHCTDWCCFISTRPRIIQQSLPFGQGLSSDVLQIMNHSLDTSASFCRTGIRGCPRNAFGYCSSYKCQQRLYWNVR